MSVSQVQNIMDQLTDSVLTKDGGHNIIIPEFFSKDCPDCRGSGVFRKITKVEKHKEKCNRCDNGYIQVTCNNCIDGYTSHGVCKTCSGWGKYTYFPTPKYPEGKKCKFCHGRGEIIKSEIITTPIKCLKCNGKGKFIQKVFNPVIRQEDAALINLVDKLAEQMFKPLADDEIITTTMIC
jgi:DnaJ-class molecular chaperone